MPIGCTDGISGFLFYCAEQLETMEFFDLLKSTDQFFMFEQFKLNVNTV